MRHETEEEKLERYEIREEFLMSKVKQYTNELEKHMNKV